jgi:nucleotide-binding universal stress UspA family protein
MIERTGAAGRKEVRMIEDDDPARGLVELAEREHPSALILGRRARRDDEPLVRLGEVCRRVLRKLPVPVIVVPPDFGEDERTLDPGPVVLATDLEEHDVAAASFARRLAERLARPLLIAHGIAPFNWGVSYLPAETVELVLEQARKQAETKLGEWMQRHALGDMQAHAFVGDPARNLAQLVVERKAAALVTGSRKLGPIERIFVASISSELAASARCPTAIVPG